MSLIFNAILASSVTAIIILITKRLMANRISPSWHLYIWLILAIRLIVPVFPESSISIYNNLPEASQIQQFISLAPSNPAPSVEIPASTPLFIEPSPVMSEVITSPNYSRLLIMAWLLVAVLMFMGIILSYIKFNAKVKKYPLIQNGAAPLVLEKCKTRMGIKREIALRLGGNTPMLKGIIKPEIVIPPGYDEKELESVLTHELCHYKQGDIYISVFATLLLCLYWYNPIIWLCFFSFRRDMEIFCDYKTLQYIENKKAYAGVLLKTALQKNSFVFAATPLQNGAKDISHRIKQIAFFKQPKLVWTILAIIIALLIAAICLTNSLSNTQSVENAYNGQQLHKYKSQYIGDASNASGLANALPYGQYKTGISLNTSQPPYGMTVNYEITPAEFIKQTENLGASPIQNGAIIFALIDNVDILTFNFGTGEDEFSLSYTREYLNEVFGRDLRKYAASKDVFENQFLPQLSNSGWVNIYINHEEAQALQNQADSGHKPGLLDQAQVAISYIDDLVMRGTIPPGTIIKTATSTNKAGEALVMLIRKEGDIILVRLIQPVNKDNTGIWAVKAIWGDNFIIKTSISDINSYSPNTAIEIEEYLEIIISSPAEASNPWAYINAHQEEYHKILKFGDEALAYLLEQFAKGNSQGLRGHIMMSLCQDILGKRNNVSEGTYFTPEEWYSLLEPYPPVKLAPYIPPNEDEIINLAYQAAHGFYNNENASVTIVAPKIFGTHYDGDSLKIYVTVYYSQYNLYGNTLYQEGGGIIPGAIEYEKNSQGEYELKNYIQAMDGSYFKKSIEDFCAPNSKIAKEIMEHYSNYEDLHILMEENTQKCVKYNGLKNITIHLPGKSPIIVD